MKVLNVDRGTAVLGAQYMVEEGAECGGGTQRN